MRKRLFGWVLPALLVCASGAWAQGQDLAGRPIQGVQLDGLEYISDQLVRAEIELQTGQPYNPRATARDLRRLYALGYFSTIEADVTVQGDGVVVTYRFQEKRLIDDIKIMGNDKIRERQISGVIGWRTGDAFVADAYNDEREAVLDLYTQKGFPNASVDIVVEEVGPARVRVTYVIDEGKKARIASIRFEGNDVLSDRQLRKLMKTRQKFYFFGGKFNEDQFEFDLDTIMNEYGDYGRLEAQLLGTNFEYAPNGRNVDVTIYLEEGPEYTVGNIEIADNSIFDDDEILGLAEVQAGDIHNRSQVADDADFITRGYVDSGYLDGRVTPQVTLDRDTKTTNITYIVREGTLKYVQEVKITGNAITKDEVIRRNLLLIPGDRFDGSLIRYSEQLLDNLRYFEPGEGVRFTTEPIEGDEQHANLLVDVTESKTGEWTGGVSYATDDGAGLFMEVELRNFDALNWPKFTGGGQNLSVRLSLNERETQYNLSFTDPEAFGYPLSVGFDLFKQETEYEGSDYEEDAQGGQVRFGKLLSPYVRTQLAVKYEDITIGDVPLFAIPELRRLWRDDGSTVSLNWSIARNTLDSRIDPTTGARHNLELEVGGFGGDHDYYKVQTDNEWFWKLDEDAKWVLSFRTRNGWVNEYGESDFVSLSDRFFAGGTATVRGYDTRDIGPYLRRFGWFGEKYRVGGELRTVNNLELKYKLLDNVRFYTFVDNAGVWADSSDFDFGEIKWSAGLGIGVEVPRLGPVRIDYGFPLNPDGDQGSGRLHLLTGFRF